MDEYYDFKIHPKIVIISGSGWFANGGSEATSFEK